MNLSITSLVALVSFWQLRCGYTVLREFPDKEHPCAQEYDVPLPDLALTGISFTQIMESTYIRERGESAVTIYHIGIRNVGRALFDGIVSLTVKSPGSPLVRGPLVPACINAGDTALVDIRLGGWHKKGTRLHFLLETNSNCFGCEPICEASYENNELAYVVP